MSFRCFKVVCLFFLLNYSFAQPKLFKKEIDPALIPREHTLDFTELKLDIALEPKEGSIKGKVTHFFTPLRSIVDNFFLDAKEGLHIKTAFLNGNSLEYKRDSTGYSFFPTKPLTFGNKYTLEITYEAKPKKGLYFIGWNDSLNISKKQIWTQGQGTDNRYWIPMYDEMNDKIISEINLTFNKEYKVLSNGAKLLEKENSDGTKTWRYRMQMPHSSYLIMLAIGKYDIKEIKSKSGVPIRLYYYPEHKERVDITFKYTSKMMDFFEKEIGLAYPWKISYSQVPVQDYMYGAMENTMATVFGDFYCVDGRSFLDRSYIGTNAHELAHMWFGDLITARSSADTWLQESFATHYQWLFDREAFGQEHFDWNRRLANNEALNASLVDKKAVGSSEGGRVRHYPKGAFVIEMIKYIVGRDQYNRAIKTYLEKNAYKNVDSNELLVVFQDVLGVSLNWFWDQWIYKGGEPHYKVSYQDLKNIKNERITEITVEQIHEVNDLVGLFKMPVRLEVWYKDGSRDTARLMIENQSHRFVIPNRNNFDIDFILFDPNSQILKSVTFNKYQEELFKQALKAPNMLDRYDAVTTLRNVDVEKKRDVLMSVYLKERFYGIKCEIVTQLINDTARSSKDLIKSAIYDKDVNVRKAVIANIQSSTIVSELDLRHLLTDSSYAIIELTLEKLSGKYPEYINQYLELTKAEIGNSGRNIRIKWLEIACGMDVEKDKNLNELISYTSSSYEFRTRINAIESIRRLNYFDKKVLLNISNAAAHFNSRLANPAENAIVYFYKQSSYKKLINDFLQQHPVNTIEKQYISRNLK